MLAIKQDSKLDRTRLKEALSRHGLLEFRVSTEAIESDIKKIEAIQKNAKGITLRNAKKVINYLGGLKNKTSDGLLKLRWELQGNEVGSIPVEMRKIKMFNVCATDYIEASEDNAIISLDYSDVFNGIAFDMIYQDLGISHKDVERRMADLSVIVEHTNKELNSIIEPNCYETALVLMIENTPYKATTKGCYYDYFGVPMGTDRFYRGIVENSRATAMSMIVYEQMTLLSKEVGDFKLAGVFEDSTCYVVPRDKLEQLEKILNMGVLTRVTGRTFKIYPNISKY